MSKIIYGADEKIPGESAYDRCSYKGCKNGKYRLGGRKLFLFPSHTESERREKWLQNCGNEELRKKADSSIRRSGICSDHFDPSCFTDEQKYSLKRKSIPRPDFPPNLCDESNLDDNRTMNTSNIATNTDRKLNSVPVRVPRLFVDDDDYFSDENAECYTDYEDLNDIQNSEYNQLNNKVTLIDRDKNNYKLEKWSNVPELFRSNDNDQFNSITEESSVSSVAASSTKQDNINTPKDNGKIVTSMSTIELLRKMNEDQNKDKKIEKLFNHNMLLRKELKTLKQNIRRWERRAQKTQKKFAAKKLTLKQQKRIVLNIVNEMDISPVAKAIISLQLHTNKAPYTEEEKNLARAFQQYSRNDLRKLRNAGCNVPSRSSIKRWLSNLDRSILLSTPNQESIENGNTESVASIEMN